MLTIEMKITSFIFVIVFFFNKIIQFNKEQAKITGKCDLFFFICSRLTKKGKQSTKFTLKQWFKINWQIRDAN